MKFVNRELKGTFGYIRKQLIFEVIKTVILFAMALGIFFIGYLTLHTKKSLWSVFAVLALLPACKSLVGVIMLARFKSITHELFEKTENCRGSVPVLYENILTSSERTFFLPVIFVCGGSIAGYAKGCRDLPALKSHMESVMSVAGHSAVVKIFDDEDDLLKRLSDVAKGESSKVTNNDAAIIETIKAVSL